MKVLARGSALHSICLFRLRKPENACDVMHKNQTREILRPTKQCYFSQFWCLFYWLFLKITFKICNFCHFSPTFGNKFSVTMTPPSLSLSSSVGSALFHSVPYRFHCLHYPTFPWKNLNLGLHFLGHQHEYGVTKITVNQQFLLKKTNSLHTVLSKVIKNTVWESVSCSIQSVEICS